MLQNLVSRNPNGVNGILDRLRQGHSVESVVAWLRGGDAELPQETDTEDHAQQVLIRLAQSIASLEEILEFAEKCVVRGYFLEQPDFSTLYNRIITLDMLLPLVNGAIMPDQADSSSSQRKQNVYEAQDQPTFVIPAAPWTNLTDDSMFVSQLISVFINYVNPYWRYLEVDLFLPNMQSGSRGTYCCNFLVNAICAFACVRSSLQSFRRQVC